MIDKYYTWWTNEKEWNEKLLLIVLNEMINKMNEGTEWYTHVITNIHHRRIRIMMSCF